MSPLSARSQREDRYLGLRRSQKWRRLVARHHYWKSNHEMWECGTCRFFIPGPAFFCTHIIDAVETPGKPDFSKANTLAELMEWNGITCDELLLCYINEMVGKRCQVANVTPNTK